MALYCGDPGETQNAENSPESGDESESLIRNLAGMPEDMRLLRKILRRFDSGNLNIYLKTEDTLDDVEETQNWAKIKQIDLVAVR